jgi:hypothetical protein
MTLIVTSSSQQQTCKGVNEMRWADFVLANSAAQPQASSKQRSQWLYVKNPIVIRDSPAKLWPAVQSETLRPRAVAQRWGTIPNVGKDHRKPTFTYSLATKNVSSMTGESFAAAIEDGVAPFVYYSGGLTLLPRGLQAEVEPDELDLYEEGMYARPFCARRRLGTFILVHL